MRLTIHPSIKGKIPKEELAKHKFNWLNIDADFDEIFELITVDGYATSSELTNDHRDGTNFVSRQLLMVDIDSGMTIDELFTNNFYNNYSAGFYATPSHTDEAHRFRIMFIIESPITDSNKLRKLNRGLLKIFEQADQACKDPVRLFFGTVNCSIKEKLDNVLTFDVIDSLLQMIDLSDQEEMTKHSSVIANYKPLNDKKKKQILDLLQRTFVGNYPIWRNVGWGLKSGGFSLTDFQYVTTGMMNQKSAADARNVWKSGSVDGDVTMGSVIYLLKSHHGPDCLAFNEQEEINELKEQIDNKLQKIRLMLTQWGENNGC